jgi:hypothetical protein
MTAVTVALASLDALRSALVAALPSGDPRAADVARIIAEARESCVRAVTAAGLHPRGRT